MEEKGNKKIIWIVVLSLLAVVLCYFFVVIYFFFIDSCNIAAKLSVWPFLSQEAKVEQFSSATVEMSFEIENKDYEVLTKNVVGINVHKDGYVVALFDDFRECKPDTKINIKSNSGKTMLGELIFGDINFNLAVIKCKNVDDSPVKLPYLSVAPDSELYKGNKVFAISPVLSESDDQLTGFNWHKMELTNKASVYSQLTYNNYVVADYYMYDCWDVNLNEGDDFSNATVVTSDGRFLGLSYEVSISQGGETEHGYSMKSVHNANSFLKDVIEADKEGKVYDNPVAKQLHGFDLNELNLYNVLSSDVNGYKDGFYFEGKLENYTKECYDFPLHFTDGGFLLFKDFAYNDAKINAGCVLTTLKVNGGDAQTISNTAELFDMVYRLKAGQKVTLSFFDLNHQDSWEEQNISFIV